MVGGKRAVASEVPREKVFLNTEFAEDTEKKEKRTGLKTGHYREKEWRRRTK